MNLRLYNPVVEQGDIIVNCNFIVMIEKYSIM